MGLVEARFSANDKSECEVLAEVRTRHENIGALTIQAVEVLRSGHGIMARLPDPSKLDVVPPCHQFEISCSNSKSSIPQIEQLRHRGVV